MSAPIKKIEKYSVNENICLLEKVHDGGEIKTLIHDQLKDTFLSNDNVLQKMQDSIYLLSIKKACAPSSLHVKKLSDRAQYALLPERHQSEIFGKLSYNQLANQCHALPPADWKISLANQDYLAASYLHFYFSISAVEKSFTQAISTYPLQLKEILSNRIMIISDGLFNYPLALSKLPAYAVWQGLSIECAILNELSSLTTKFQLYNDLFASLKRTYINHEWVLADGIMHYSHKGITRSLDYASLLDDILFTRHEDRMDEYLQFFDLLDLEASSFPTVSVRSQVYLKVRPKSLSLTKSGHVMVAATENLGKQRPIDVAHHDKLRAFNVWLKRAERHLPRHNYKARVVFLDDKHHHVFALVGEQIASIAIYPQLIKAVYDSLYIKNPKKINVIAHNEDVLTIAQDGASWIDINAVSEKASALFRLIANDGSDPLSLFEQVTLPDAGAGNFQLKVVQDTFFELLHTAQTMKNSMPPGHDHYLLGLAYECLHEWGLAVAEFKKALRLDAGDPDILHGLGCALMEIGQVSEALPFLKHAFDLMPEDAEVANNLGRGSIECGHIADAITAFERAVKLSPATADYLKNLGDGYLLASRLPDALASFNKAVRCDPHFAAAHASLAQIHLVAGEEDLAKKHALLAYKENPVDKAIANLLWQLTLGKK